MNTVGHKLKAGVVLGCGLLLTACATVQTTNSGVVGVNRQQRMSALGVSSQEMNMAAAQGYTQEMSAAQQKGLLNRDPAVVNRVKSISQKIIAQVGVFRPDAQAWPWEVNVVSKDEPNAYCMAGGKIAVYSGLVSKLNTTDDELASVIAHEIAHALREHGREKVSQAQLQGLGLAVLGAATKNDKRVDQAGQLSTLFLTLPNSREMETEADAMGLELMARAGYNPQAAVVLWQKMAQLGGTPPEFLSTHPDPQNRIGVIQSLLPKVMPLYQAAQVPVMQPKPTTTTSPTKKKR